MKTLRSQIATQKPEKETRQLSAFYMEQLEAHPDIFVNDENTKTWSQLARFYQGKIQKIFFIGTIKIFWNSLVYLFLDLSNRFVPSYSGYSRFKTKYWLSRLSMCSYLCSWYETGWRKFLQIKNMKQEPKPIGQRILEIWNRLGSGWVHFRKPGPTRTKKQLKNVWPVGPLTLRSIDPWDEVIFKMRDMFLYDD